MEGLFLESTLAPGLPHCVRVTDFVCSWFPWDHENVEYMGWALCDQPFVFSQPLLTDFRLPRIRNNEIQSPSHFCFCFTFWKKEGLVRPELRKHPFFGFSQSVRPVSSAFWLSSLPDVCTDRISCFSSLRLVCESPWWWGMALWGQSAPGGVTDKLLPYQLS